ncbi:uncharacterized protein [Coffea arabica]|uniref:Uncharacterized protein n=1 Tax=Coffea arabica TaxID=13443 RepID=A0ABM4VH81_COFAR
MGDFNDITSNRKKWGGNLRAEVRFQDFNSLINNNELVDISFEGVPWTWCNNWGNEGEVKERGKMWKKRFMFDRRWLLNKDIKEVVGKAWGEHQQECRLYRVQCKIKKVRIDLLSWSRRSFSNAKKLIEQVKKEIGEVKLNRPSGFRIKLLGLKRKLATAYKKEELFWSQKARLKWLKEGDKNTGYFHATMAGRRKANRIRVLRRRNGDWYGSEEEAREEILDYFEQIFTSVNPEEFA